MTNWKYTKGSEKDFDGAPDCCEFIMFNHSDDIPKSGQFSAVWETKNGTFAQTFKYRDDGYLLAYDMYNDEWQCEHGYSEEFLVDVKATFIV